MGRPPSKPKRFKDGYYIEVRTKGADSGMKIWSETREDMTLLAEMYRQNKDVIIMGEHKKDRWVDIEPAPRPRGRQKAIPKIEELDPIDELLGDIDLEAIEEAGEKKGKKEKNVPAVKIKKTVSVKVKPEKAKAAKAKPIAKAKSSTASKVKPKPAAKAKAKPAVKAKVVKKKR
ncbi:MAG: hypothetical protein IPP77_14660 [Bacteroidetes bacterium]|nr:hypothetical protein [Bacteroidota bacterium]